MYKRQWGGEVENGGNPHSKLLAGRCYGTKLCVVLLALEMHFPLLYIISTHKAHTSGVGAKKSKDYITEIVYEKHTLDPVPTC